MSITEELQAASPAAREDGWEEGSVLKPCSCLVGQGHSEPQAWRYWDRKEQGPPSPARSHRGLHAGFQQVSLQGRVVKLAWGLGVILCGHRTPLCTRDHTFG